MVFSSYRSRPNALVLVALVAAALTACAPDEPGASEGTDAPFDVLITNARVVDGMGNPWYRADVGLRGELKFRSGREESCQIPGPVGPELVPSLRHPTELDRFRVHLARSHLPG